MSEGNAIFQRQQPRGVPPLEMTGERTLPDVPQEHYWYQRHVVVYEWVARRASGKRVLDMACGEGYGSAILASTAREVVGVDANPEAFEHARLKYRYSNLRFARELVEDFAERADVVVFLQTIEHVRDPVGLLRHFKSLLEPGGELIVSTPNLLTLAAPGQEKSDNPWHIKEYRPDEFDRLLEPHFGQVELYGLYHARKLLLHDRIVDLLRIPRDAIHRHAGPARVFREAFLRSTRTTDFRLRPAAEIRELLNAQDLVAVLRS